MTELTTYNMYSVPIEPFNTHEQMYRILVPGVTESAPHISIGDVVLVRRVDRFDGIEWE
ncbi:hypothetical protein HK102_001546, partial [Quaeritorhiza haematococci]